MVDDIPDELLSAYEEMARDLSEISTAHSVPIKASTLLGIIARLRKAETQASAEPEDLFDSELLRIMERRAARNSFGALIRKHRVAARLTLGDTARAIRAATSYLGEIERGERGPMARDRWPLVVQTLPTLTLHELREAAAGWGVGNAARKFVQLVEREHWKTYWEARHAP